VVNAVTDFRQPVQRLASESRKCIVCSLDSDDGFLIGCFNQCYRRATTLTWIPGGGSTPYSGLYGEAPPERGAFCKLAVYQRVGKIAILVYERVSKSAAKWKKWWLK